MTYQKILEILSKCDFPNPEECGKNPQEMLTQDNCLQKIIIPLREQNLFNDEWVYENGVSKLVIISKHLPYVIKIPFMGASWECDSYDTYSIKPDKTKIPVMNLQSKDFNKRHVPAETGYDRFYIEQAYDDDYKWDYCGLEVRYYQEAVESGLEVCFAKEKLIGYINHFPIYIQDKVTTFTNHTFERSSDEDYKKVQTALKSHNDFLYDEENTINEDWLANFVAYFGEEMLTNFLDFIRDHEINDLHIGNIGYIEDVPVLMDYSGYFGTTQDF